ncbi:MAG: hypothetical protein EOR30_34325 [Mesorhizobium sp.]|uniref:hypothetical protein n=1 Tax=unclassified Mesorhizobium TaxID=325217 RepID=UPI000FCA6378|nr:MULTISPECIES: hypothetical protein [unclassified Mesorhizobium]RUV66746.1 hypothetical protein EOA78_33030 [Mesorhizobium sp. M5C.F.Cr.IN.023.01.1.1]RWF80814.1 MAG: hypothetical protein EOQ36_32090 [Mesorhizobium sp.]RWF88408.1 MAG: hypothetical protein EOQ45_32365 [Mesorhizobium sp.]RWI32042.1 MAG: hypothetical protein EOR14_35470 [Mesorhizobium sp.]RWI41559.1 MAG: hypothetical protein EOR15_32705 [Mesorhizobium sp.]
MRDLYHNLGVVLALTPAVKTAAGDGAAIDTKGYGSVAFAVNTGAIVAAGDFGIKVQHSDTSTSGDFVDAPAGTFFSNAPATLAASSAYKMGYIGDKRYCRLSLTYASGTSIAAGAVAVLGNAANKPVA